MIRVSIPKWATEEGPPTEKSVLRKFLGQRIDRTLVALIVNEIWRIRDARTCRRDPAYGREATRACVRILRALRTNHPEVFVR